MLFSRERSGDVCRMPRPALQDDGYAHGATDRVAERQIVPVTRPVAIDRIERISPAPKLLDPSDMRNDIEAGVAAARVREYAIVFVHQTYVHRSDDALTAEMARASVIFARR